MRRLRSSSFEEKKSSARTWCFLQLGQDIFRLADETRWDVTCTLHAYKGVIFVIAFCVVPHYFHTLNLYCLRKPNSFCEDCCFLACMSDVMVIGRSML